MPVMKGGGAEKVAALLLNEFNKNGYECELVLTNSDRNEVVDRGLNPEVNLTVLREAFPKSSALKKLFISMLRLMSSLICKIPEALGKKVPAITWACVVFGCIGMFFLCIDPANPGSVNRGDVLAFICAVFYGVHILLVEKLVPDVDGVKLSCVQFAVSGAISCVLMFLFETPQLPAIRSALLPILYSGVMSCGVGYTFQIVGQKYTEATIATLIMCLESVFGVLAGALLLNEILTVREVLGCEIMFVAIVLSQLSDMITEKLGKRKAVSGK